MIKDTVEDVKNELRVLAEFLDDGFFAGSTPEQTNLLIELVVMKMKAIAKE